MFPTRQTRSLLCFGPEDSILYNTLHLSCERRLKSALTPQFKADKRRWLYRERKSASELAIIP
jgi:hypothetical protein